MEDIMQKSTASAEDINELVHSLKELQSAKYDSRSDILASCAQADRVLNLIYDLGAEKALISNESKAVIGPLLVDSLKSFEIGIKGVALYETSLSTAVLRKRSALQFLIDDFGDCPTGTSGRKFADFVPDIIELADILDELISKCKAREYFEDRESDREEKDLPASHTWWAD